MHADIKQRAHLAVARSFTRLTCTKAQYKRLSKHSYWHEHWWQRLLLDLQSEPEPPGLCRSHAVASELDAPFWHTLYWKFQCIQQQEPHSPIQAITEAVATENGGNGETSEDNNNKNGDAPVSENQIVAANMEIFAKHAASLWASRLTDNLRAMGHSSSSDDS